MERCVQESSDLPANLRLARQPGRGERKVGALREPHAEALEAWRRRRRSYNSKTKTSPKKDMLSVWWNSMGIVYWELIPVNSTVPAAVYYMQLDRVALVLEESQDKVCLLHDNP